MSISVDLDERGELVRIRAQRQDVRLERVGEDEWFVRVGDATGENVVVHLQTVAEVPEIRSTFARQLPRRSNWG